MVNVPTSFGPEVQLDPLTHARLAPFAEVRQNALPGALTKTMGALGEMQQRADNLRVEDSLNRLRSAQTGLETDYGTRLGGNVQPQDGKAFGEVYGGKFDEAAKGIEDTLTDRQRKAFRQKTGLLRVAYMDGVSKHEATQLKQFGIQTDEGTIALENTNAARNAGNQMELTLGRIRSQAAVESMAKQLGWDEATTQGALQKTLTNFHTAVIGGALDRKNFAYAKQYLEEKQDEMDPAQVAKVRKVIAQTGDAVQQEKDFERIRDSGKTLEGQLREVEKLYPEDPVALKAVQSDLVAWHGHLKASQAAEQQTLSGQVQEMYRPTLPGGKALGITQIRQTPEWTKLDPKERQDLLDYWERLAKGHDPDNDPTTAITRFASYLQILDDPKKLVGMSDGQIAAYNRVLGPRLTMDLMKDKRAIAQDQQAAQMKAEEFNALANEYGLNVASQNGDKAKDAMRATLGKLRNQVFNAMRAEERRTGKDLGQDEREQLFRKFMKTVPITTGRAWYRPNTTEETPLFQLLGDATEEERRIAERYLEKNGTEATPENVWTMIQGIRAKQKAVPAPAPVAVPKPTAPPANKPPSAPVDKDHATLGQILGVFAGSVQEGTESVVDSLKRQAKNVMEVPK